MQNHQAEMLMSKQSETLQLQLSKLSVRSRSRDAISFLCKQGHMSWTCGFHGLEMGTASQGSAGA